MIAVIATLCLAGVGCVDKLVTSNSTGAECGLVGPVYISRWMDQEGFTVQGYKLVRWKCISGGKRLDT